MKRVGLLLIILLIGCTPHYEIIKSGDDNIDVKLDKNATAYVSLPEDCTSKGYLYGGSGRETAGALMLQFAKHMNNVFIGDEVETLEEALGTAQGKGYMYVIQPVILQWEDYSTEWNGIPDVLRLKVSVIETESEKRLDTFMIDGKGKVMSWGGDHPLDIAEEPLTKWVDSLF